MTPVAQSKIVGRDGYGTCWSACLASLLHLPEAAVPHFADPARFTSMGTGSYDLEAYVHVDRPLNWWLACKGWLRMLDHELVTVPATALGDCPDPFLIASGLSPRSPGPDGEEIHHAVIYQRQPDGRYVLAHDPYPGGGGLVGDPTHFYAVRTVAPTATP